MLTYLLENFGCRATQADGAALERELAHLGMAPAAVPVDAHFAIINSCTVTSAADADARAAVRRIHRENPDCRILVTGCYAQRAPEEVASLPGVKWVVGNSHKSEVAALLAAAPAANTANADFQYPSRVSDAGPSSAGDIKGNNFVAAASLLASSPEAAMQLVGDIFAHTELMAAPVFESSGWTKTRPNLKVQDGCDNRCSFCIIPFVRGQSRSLPLEAALREAGALVNAGYKEMVLSGINLGRWGRDLSPALHFVDLVRALLERTGIQRLRISSVEPMDWSDELIQLCAASPRICKHAHLPLQSGSDRVLRMMHRKYRPWHYAEKVRKIHDAMPEAAIGADVMVGFPGETDELFEESRSFIERLPFTYLHVFTYSARPGTAAAKMPGHVPPQVARERNKVLRDLITEKNLHWRQSFVGKTLEAITLHTNADGTTEALTNNFARLRLGTATPANELLRLPVTSLTADGFMSA